MKFYLNGAPNLQINETKKMATCIYWRQKKKKKVYSLPNKNQDRSELILIEIQSFQIEKAPHGGPYQDTQVTISGRSVILPYYMKFWRHFNLAIFLKT